MSLTRTQKIIAICVGSLSLVAAAWPAVVGDFPPLANIARVEKASEHLVKKIDVAQNSLEALIVRGNILGTWRSCRQAQREGDQRGADEYATQISALQTEYEMLTGFQYMLPACP